LYKIFNLFRLIFRGTMFLFLTPCACCQFICLKYRLQIFICLTVFLTPKQQCKITYFLVYAPNLFETFFKNNFK